METSDHPVCACLVSPIVIIARPRRRRDPSFQPLKCLVLGVVRRAIFFDPSYDIMMIKAS